MNIGISKNKQEKPLIILFISADALINVITLTKSYLVLRTYQHYSPWNNERAVRTCKKMKCQASVYFAIKAELKKRPYFMLGILMLVTIIYLGLAMRTFEMFFILFVFLLIKKKN